jgi:hypothetical protein
MENIYVNKAYQAALCDKWGKVLDAGEAITNSDIRTSTALVMETVQREADVQKLIREAAPAGGIAAYSGGAFGSWSNDSYGAGTTDARVPTVIIPLIRRIFPKLIAHELVGVQPMSGPVGFVYALRFEYGINGQFQSSGAHQITQGKELGYNNLDSTFTGMSGTSTVPSVSASYWQAYAGAGTTNLYGGESYPEGQGAYLSASEWAALGTNMPTGQFSFKKAIVEAKERMLGGMWSQELAEDMLKMHGLNADEEMSNALSYELQAGIDRQVVSEMVRSAIIAGMVSTWSPVSADGRNQLERIGTLWTQILEKSNDVAAYNRLGAANFAVAAPKVCSLLQRANQVVTVKLDKSATAPMPSEIGTAAVARVGMLGDTHALYRDTFAGSNYCLLGFKGKTPLESGVIYCPYIPLQISRTVGYSDFNPRIRIRTRDGIIGETNRPDPFLAGYFYHFIKIDNLTGSGLVSDAGSIGGRIFTY